MDDKKIRLAVGALAVSAATLVGIATHEGYRSEAYKDTVGIPTPGNAYTFRSTSTNSTPTSVWPTTSGQGRSADPHW